MRAALDQIVLAQETDFSLGRLSISPSKRLVAAGAARELLQPRIMQVLVVLARRRGDVVSRDALMATCWGGFAVSDDAIQRCVARLRKLAETHGGFHLETIPRVGYQLIEISGQEAAYDETPPESEALPLPVPRLSATGPHHWAGRQGLVATASFMAGALVTAAGFLGAHLL